MVGAGKADGAMDAGNMLKPALARGTALRGRDYLMNTANISKRCRLERRFQKYWLMSLPWKIPLPFCAV